MKYLLIYLLAINFVGFIVMYSDKKRAIKKKYRIPEKTLFLVALVGGSLGTTLGMETFRHKTKHWYFKWGMPTILGLQIIILVLVMK
ncbi:MAG: DUF1294 domain-containing protein [Niameybacter sp.]|uniref:DUF1294 domain-containing protein n=1 Tax=Niameybacter sp. TaxID=2033640 RepID=UPI002FC690CF